MASPKNIVVLTGSGISAESGVATFRDAGGIWAKYNYREVASPEGFAANPGLVHEFYNERRRGLVRVVPNAAHIALAKLEVELARSGGRLTIITQNVDNLHERAGSTSMLHIHGELTKVTCGSCSAILSSRNDISVKTRCGTCQTTGAMRPYIVWFGEMPRFMGEANDAILEADLFVSIGTSGPVYPAAGFAGQASALGIDVMELNLEPSENAYLFQNSRYGLATKVVPLWVDEVLREI